MPGAHRLVSRFLTRGRHGRLPVLGIDGRKIGDSTAIIAELERLQPEPALYPEDPAERKRALELEDFFDEELAPRTRRLVFQHILGDRDASIAAAMPGPETARHRLMRRFYPVVRRAVSGDYGISEKGASEAIDGVSDVFDRIERELGGRQYLVGERFSIADLAAAALSTPLIGPPERPYLPPCPPSLESVRSEFESRPAGAYVLEIYRRHRGAPVATGKSSFAGVRGNFAKRFAGTSKSR